MVDTLKELLYIIRRIYQHELTSKELRTYIRFECGQFFASDIAVKEFLDAPDGTDIRGERGNNGY